MRITATPLLRDTIDTPPAAAEAELPAAVRWPTNWATRADADSDDIRNKKGYT
jgi:hypothetical protein